MTTRTRRRNALPAIPPQLAGLLSLVQETTDTAHADEMARALAAARDTMADVARRDVFDDVADFLATEAGRGAWKDAHALLDSYGAPQESPIAANAADLANCYGIPGLLLGMALTYVYLAEGGAR